MTEMTIGHLRTGCDAGCASAVARVLEAHEVEVAFLDLDRDERAAALAAGRVDLLVSAWMPRDLGLAGSGARVIGGLYRPSYVWAFTGALPAGQALLSHAGTLDVARIITTPDLEERLSALLGTDAVGGCRASVELCEPDALHDRVRHAVAQGERAIVAVEQPHAIFHDAGFSVLEDPAGALGGEMEARMILGPEAARECEPDLLDELDEMMLGNKVMSALDHAITVDDMDPEDAAEAWQRGRLLPR
ncbi:glycine betaine ABC transporter substrate-binding protein [Tanticharoenia sakaeratensis]|nr:glycine betaine ABC transporter substrate-binding protein [Tanticharoenia sakaeratensis]